MFHLDNTSAVPEMPEPKEAQSNTPRWFGESQSQGGISWPGADWFNIVQAELLAILALVDESPDKTNHAQISEAIRKLQSEFPNLLSKPDGAKGVGRCSDVSTLRGIEPEFAGQKIDLISHHPGWATLVSPIGGGLFTAIQNSSIEDDNGIFFRVNQSWGWCRIFDGSAYVEWFGAMGNGIADDSLAFQYAANWLCKADYRHLTTTEEKKFRISNPVIFDFNGKLGCSFKMLSPISPDSTTGDALTFINTRDCYFGLYVSDGGSELLVDLPDYTKPDPIGCQQAFVIRGVRQCEFDIKGFNYKGRVLRVKKEVVGEHKTSANTFKTFRTGENFNSCGQAFFAEGSTNFGSFGQCYFNWDDYGSVLRKVTDVIMLHVEAGWNNKSGMILEGVGSFNGKLNIGNENPGANITSFTCKAASDGTKCSRIRAELLIAGPYRGVDLSGLDADAGGNKILVTSSQAREIGVMLTATRSLDLTVYSTGDMYPVRLSGDSRGTDIRLVAALSKNQAFQGDADGHNYTLSGYIRSAGLGFTGSPCIRIDSLSDNIHVNDMHVQTVASLNNAGAYQLQPGNGVRISRGKIERDSANTPVFVSNVLPYKVFDVTGFVNRTSSATFIPSGATSVTVAHGMNVRPRSVQIQPSSGFTSTNWRVPLLTDDTTFTVLIPTALSGDAYFYWSAEAITP